MSGRWSRRELVARIGGAAALLPLLDPPRARGAGAAGPRRLVIVQTTNGVIHDAFWPRNTDRTAFELDAPILKPLASYKRDLVLLGGLELRAGLEDRTPMAGGLGHKSLPHLLTGAFGTAGRATDGRTDVIGNAISIDQHVALALQKQTPTRFKSLELGILTSLAGPRGDNGGYISFNGPAVGSSPARVNGNRPEESPYRLYDRLFSAGLQPGQGSAAIDPDALARQRDEKKSAIDFVAGELRRLQASLGAEERQKLEAHLAGVRRIEQELASPAAAPRPAASACQTPRQDGTRIDLTKASSMPAAARAMFDLLAVALACDLTRVVTVMMSNNSNEDLAMYWLGAGFDGPPAAVGAYKVRDHHNLAHTPDFRPQKIRADQWFVEQFAYLVEACKKVPEGSGTLLDNSVLWLANNMDHGGGHTVRGMPWVLVGSCGGAIRTGQYLRFGDWGQSAPSKGSRFIPHNGLLVSLANAMGVPTEKFGRYDDGELAGIRG